MVVLHSWSVWQESFSVSWLNFVNSSNTEWRWISSQSDLFSHWDLTVVDKGKEGKTGGWWSLIFRCLLFNRLTVKAHLFILVGVAFFRNSLSVCVKEETNSLIETGETQLEKNPMMASDFYRVRWRTSLGDEEERKKKKSLKCFFMNRCASWRILGTF